jgi:hypothetical protein
LYRTIGEVGCSFFKGQGKITNIQWGKKGKKRKGDDLLWHLQQLYI